MSNPTTQEMLETIKRLNNALREEAAYCDKYYNECLGRGETERASRHAERRDRLLSRIEEVST